MLTTPSASVPQTGPVVGVRAAQPGHDGASAQTPPASAAPAATQADPASTPVPPPASSQIKLVVARADASLAYTYTLVDQVTGRVVAEIPHQAAQDAAAKPDYTAGGVVDTTA